MIFCEKFPEEISSTQLNYSIARSSLLNFYFDQIDDGAFAINKQATEMINVENSVMQRYIFFPNFLSWK